MKKIDRILKQLSDLYEFNRWIKSHKLKKREAASKRAERVEADRHTPQP